MKNFVLVVVFVLVGIFLWRIYPGNPKPSQALAPSARAEGPPEGVPGDYFPHQVGTEWQYDVSTGPAEPLEYREVAWRMGSSLEYIASRGRYRPYFEAKTRNFVLRMKVQGPSPEQGPLKYRDGVELAVLEDGLGIFENHHRIFWAVGTAERYMANEIVTFPPDSPGAPGMGGPWGGWGAEDGYSMRLVFFADKPGIAIGFGEHAKDMTAFVGAESCNGIPCLHFVRTVEAGKADDRVPHSAAADYLDRGFTEDRWFAKGKGLVRLEQKVDGRTSMTWTLTKFCLDHSAKDCSFLQSFAGRISTSGNHRDDELSPLAADISAFSISKEMFSQAAAGRAVFGR
jgi:hypothetical protein